MTDTMEVANVVNADARKEGNLFGKKRLKSKMNPRFLAEEVGGMDCVEWRKSNGLMNLVVSCGSPIRRNSVLKD